MSQAQDIDAINDFFNSTAAKTADAAMIKNAWPSWYSNLSWGQKYADSGTYDDARAKRDAFNTANVTSNEERLNVERVQTTGLRSEDVAASNDQLLGSRKAKSVVRPATAAPALHSMLKRGMSGREVKTWQHAIGITPEDGSFGAGTEAATKTFQRSKGLMDDGIVGPKTWLAAYAADPSVPTPVAVVDSSGTYPTAVAPNPAKNVPVYQKPTAPVLTPRAQLHPTAKEEIRKISAAAKTGSIEAVRDVTVQSKNWWHKFLHFLHIEN